MSKHTKTIPKKRSKRDGRPSKANSVSEGPLDIEVLAAQQGVKPIEKPEDLRGDFWPEDESVDDFLKARKRWQREGRR